MAFAKIFGTKPPSSVPPAALVSWFSRDLMAMGVIFVAPPIVATKMHLSMNMDKRTAENIAQISLPVLMQPISTPLHLLGYQVYNEPTASWKAHASAMRKTYFDSVVIRCIRIFPPYSVGTIFNKALRREFHKASGLD